jgi:hypothetical protein
VGSQPLYMGREGRGGGEEEPRSDASSQVESEGSDPPPFNIYGVAVQCIFCRYYLFPVILVVIF